MSAKLVAARRAAELVPYTLHFVVVTPENAARIGKSKASAFDVLKGLKLVRGIDTSIREQRFSGESLSISLPIPTIDGKSIILVGRGKLEKKPTFETVGFYRSLGALIADTSARHGAAAAALSGEGLEFTRDNVIALKEGLELSQYRFRRYQAKAPRAGSLGKLVIPASGKEAADAWAFGEALSEATAFARDLVNTPACDCPPRRLVAEARAIAKKYRIKCDVFDQNQLRRMGAGALLAVAKGSDEPPFLIRMTYTPPRASGAPLALVGKGVTFDSGGLSIKTAGGMENMKVDMSGAAATLACMRLVGQLKPKRKVTAYIPTTENMINGVATRPGDVVKGMSGKTIEILNTDAEGRLILSDALTLAVRDGCRPIIDLATLTGACMVALGTEYAGLFATDDDLAKDLADAGAKAGERLWRMPLAPEYQDLIKSPIADIKNTGGPFGGAITGALFLKAFVGETPWAHLDIAGPASADSDRGFKRRGGTGFGVRTLARYLFG